MPHPDGISFFLIGHTDKKTVGILQEKLEISRVFYINFMLTPS
jgi:hypothetical protein